MSMVVMLYSEYFHNPGDHFMKRRPCQLILKEGIFTDTIGVVRPIADGIRVDIYFYTDFVVKLDCDNDSYRVEAVKSQRNP